MTSAFFILADVAGNVTPALFLHEQRDTEEMIVFERQVLKQMKEDAEGRYPGECCGILLGRREEDGKRIAEEVFPTANEVSDGRERRFEIDSLTLLKAERYAADSGMEIVGFYHSHPDCEARASTEDERYALPECSYPILSVLQGEVLDMTSWELKGKGAEKNLQKERIQYREEGERTLCQ